MKTYQSSSSARKRGFFGRNLYAFLIGFTVIAIATVVTLGIVLYDTDKSSAPVGPSQPTFVLPLNEFEVAQEVNLTQLVYNPSLDQWQTVTGMTFSAQAGEDVVVVTDGVITKITDSLLDGRVVTVEHSDGLVSIYKSLDNSEETTLVEGQTVTVGTKLGTTSNSMMANAHFGDQLYLEMKQEGKFIDPLNYLPQIETAVEQ